jgi:hypothetical protein
MSGVAAAAPRNTTASSTINLRKAVNHEAHEEHEEENA